MFELALASGMVSGALLRRRLILSIFLMLISIALALFGESVEFWIARLGADSLSEARSFQIDEAIFFLGTLGEVLQPRPHSLALGLVLLAFAGALVWVGLPPGSGFLRRGRVRTILVLSGILLLASLVKLWQGPLRSFAENTLIVRNYEKAFLRSGFPQVTVGNRELNLVIYIGESTSIMNMGLYGYYRNTTPGLDMLARDDAGMIVFDKVSSTHTHTTPSLAEALSLSACEWGMPAENLNACPPGWRQLPIDEQKRISLIDVLIESGRSVTLFSNQNQSGSWNAAANVIFRNAQRLYSVASLPLGNVEKSKPYDGDFFRGKILNCVEGTACGGDASGKIVVLHSYAGHGPYRRNIPPEFRRDVDGVLRSVPESAVVGSADHASLVDNVEAYDSAVRYVDAVVSEQIAAVRKLEAPTVLVYFSDHGDSAYTGRGHDSSRYIHEMTRVPLIIYFNPPARTRYAPLYEKYLELSRQGSPSTLRQLAPTILDLLGAGSTEPARARQLVSNAVIGQKSEQHPILVRRTFDGVRSVPVAYRDTGAPQEIDASSVAFSVSNEPGHFDEICSHRSNSIARIRRGSLSGVCLEFDVTALPNGDLKVFHPPATDVGLGLAEALQIASKAGASLWIDAKSLVTAQACLRHEEALAAVVDVRSILLELPSPAHTVTDPEFVSCIRRLVARGISVSHYVPTEPAMKCAKALKRGGTRKSVESCSVLDRDLASAMASGMFTDISFDYRGLAALEGVSWFENTRKNTWFIPPGDLYGDGSVRFHKVILRGDDVNFN